MLKKVGCFKFFFFQISPCLICLSRINCFLILNVQRTWVTGDHSHHTDHFWLQRKRMLFGWNNAPRLYLMLKRSRDLLTQVAKNCKLGQGPWLSSCLLLSLSTSVFLISWDLNLTFALSPEKNNCHSLGIIHRAFPCPISEVISGAKTAAVPNDLHHYKSAPGPNMKYDKPGMQSNMPTL